MIQSDTTRLLLKFGFLIFNESTYKITTCTTVDLSFIPTLTIESVHEFLQAVNG
jgi:hypothetical protein